MRVLIVLLLLLTSACSTTQHTASGDPASSTDVAAKPYNPDPWEGFNRQMFRFNDMLDRAFLKPAAKGYRAIAPDPVEVGVSNFFNNLGEVRTVVNSVLQWKWKNAANSTGRFLVNSTIGLVGLFDVAEKMGMEASFEEDFGQTLATWGVARGPFVVLPFFGPSTLRDGVGTVTDWYTDPLTYLDDETAEYGIKVLGILDTRAGLLDSEEVISGDKYLFIRDAYLQLRDYEIKDGEVEDTFGEEPSDDDGYDALDGIDF